MAHGRGNNHMTIDLTLSDSPSSPEPGPSRAPYRSSSSKAPQRAPVKREAVTPARVRVSGTQSRASSSTNVPRQIPSDRIRDIIRSTPPDKVNDLLIQLCSASPALAGAVTRGLAPHSTWAQQTIRDYQRRHGLSRVQSQPRSQQRSQTGQTRQTVDLGSASDSDGSDDLQILDLPPRPVQRNASQLAMPTRVKPERGQTPARFCAKCGTRLSQGGSCQIHTGTLVTALSGARKWNCCNQHAGVKGCFRNVHKPQ